MPELRPLADVEAVVIAHLVDDVDLGILVGGTGDDARIATELANDFPDEGREDLQVFRVGGTTVDAGVGHIDRAVLQVNAYGAEAESAWELAAMAFKTLLLAPGSTHDGAVIAAVDRVSGPAWSPDPVTDCPRYIASYAVVLHPLAPVAS